MKNSTINNVKISQNSLNPNIVRITLGVNDSKILNKIQMSSINNQLIIKYGSDEIENPYFKEIYKNYKNDKYQNSSVRVQLVQENNTKDDNEQNILTHNYYLNDIKTVASGVFLKGLGVISIKNITTLEEPNRLVVDIDDAFLNPNLRGKNFEF